MNNYWVHGSYISGQNDKRFTLEQVIEDKNKRVIFEFKDDKYPTVFQAIAYKALRGGAFRLESNNYHMINYLESKARLSRQEYLNNVNDSSHYMNNPETVLVQGPVEDTPEYSDYLIGLVYTIMEFGGYGADKLATLICDRKTFDDMSATILKGFITVIMYDTKELNQIREKVAEERNKSNKEPSVEEAKENESV